MDEDKMSIIKDGCKRLFLKLLEKYNDHAAICDLVERECEVRATSFSSWIGAPNWMVAQPFPDGTVKRIYGLLKGAWENPQPTDFPKGPQTKAQALGVIVPKPLNKMYSNAKAKEDGRKRGPKVKRPTHAEKIQNYYSKYSNLPPVSAADAKEALLRLQQPGGSILPDYKPDS